MLVSHVRLFIYLSISSQVFSCGYFIVSSEFTNTRDRLDKTCIAIDSLHLNKLSIRVLFKQGIVDYFRRKFYQSKQYVFIWHHETETCANSLVLKGSFLLKKVCQLLLYQLRMKDQRLANVLINNDYFLMSIGISNSYVNNLA